MFRHTAILGLKFSIHSSWNELISTAR